MKYIAAFSLSLFAHFLSGQNPAGDSLGYELYLTRIALSEAQYHLGEISDAKATLGATPSTFRGWEFDYLHAAFDRSERTLKDHASAVTFVSFSPDGKLLASCGMDSSIFIWSYPELKILKKLNGHAGGVSTLDFSPDGKSLASGARDARVKVWDVASGKELLTLTEGLSKGIYAVKFTPDGKRLGVTSWEWLQDKGVNGIARIYNLPNGSLFKHFDLDPHPISAIDFSPDGKKAFIGSWGQIVTCHDLENDNLDWKFDMDKDFPEEYNAVNSAELSPDGRWGVSTGKDSRTRLYDAATGKIIYQIEPHEGHKKWINAVRFSADGKLLATGGEDQLIQVREAATGKLLHSLWGHDDFVNSLSFHPDGAVLASASRDGSLKIWNLEKTGEITFDVCINGPWYAPVSPTTPQMAAACSDSLIGIWNLNTGQRDKVLTGKNANCAVFSPDGTLLASAGHDKSVRIWDIADEKEIQAWEGHTSSIFGIDWNGDLIASAGGDIRIWNFKTGKAEKLLTFEGNPAYAVAFSPDGGKLAAGMSDGKVYIFDTGNWKQLMEFRAGKDSKYLVFDSSGERLVSTSRNIYLMDLKTGKMQEFIGHKNAVYGVSFHPDDKYLLSGSYDKTAKFWDTVTGRCTLTLHGFEKEIYTVSVLKNGKILLTGTDGKVRVERY